MSIPVPLDRLAETLAAFDHAYLLTVSTAGTVKVNAVDPSVVGGELRIAIPAVQARLNIDANPAVTVLWPPRVHHGHTLIVDGAARHDPEAIAVAPGHAILHRPGDHADGPDWAAPASGD